MRAKRSVTVEHDKQIAFAAYNWLLVSEFAAAIRASDDFVRDRIRAEVSGFQIRGAVKKGRDYLIPPSELERYIRENEVKTADDAA